jgi:hypothetical protein
MKPDRAPIDSDKRRARSSAVVAAAQNPESIVDVTSLGGRAVAL